MRGKRQEPSASAWLTLLPPDPHFTDWPTEALFKEVTHLGPGGWILAPCARCEFKLCFAADEVGAGSKSLSLSGPWSSHLNNGYQFPRGKDHVCLVCWTSPWYLVSAFKILVG